MSAPRRHARSLRPEPASYTRSAGFTLIELLVVIVILGVLAGIAIFAVSAFRKDAAGAGYDADRRQLETAIVAYFGQNHAYPGDLQQLVAEGYIDHVNISGDRLHLVGQGYTITFTPGSPPTLSDKASALAAGDAPIDPGGGSPSPSQVATSMSASVAAGNAVDLGGNGSNHKWAVTMTVTVLDNLGVAVSGAAVSVSWSYTTDGPKTAVDSAGMSCSTGGAGTCTVTATGLEPNVKTATATVTGVVKGGLTFSGSPSAQRTRPF